MPLLNAGVHVGKGEGGLYAVGRPATLPSLHLLLVHTPLLLRPITLTLGIVVLVLAVRASTGARLLQHPHVLLLV